MSQEIWIGQPSDLLCFVCSCALLYFKGRSYDPVRYDQYKADVTQWLLYAIYVSDALNTVL